MLLATDTIAPVKLSTIRCYVCRDFCVTVCKLLIELRFCVSYLPFCSVYSDGRGSSRANGDLAV